MEDPVVCADGHSYERGAIEKWLQTRQTSPSTNAPLPHKNLVPNHALRNLIAEARGVRRPTTVEQHALVATPCKVEEDDVTGASVPTTAPTDAEQQVAAREQVRQRGSDDETAAAPEHAAEFAQPLQPCAALCLQVAASSRRNMPVTKNSLHWAMVAGPQGEHTQLRLLHSDPDLAAQADQGGNLPLHYAAASGVSSAVTVACALAYMEGIEWLNKTGHTPIDIALREGNHSLAAVLTGVQNRQRNDLHVAFDAGPSLEDQQLRLLDCRPELAAQRDPEGNLPLHVGAAAGLSIAVLEKCSEVYKEGPTRRNAAGFFPHQLALEHGHRLLAERLALLAGKALPARPVNSLLAQSRPAAAGATAAETEGDEAPPKA
eukprot:Transcript_20916.p2 GENE.Transcript_20916~~Transcript_20916.p2  ORF type:complete len:375 (+),score=152.16 Transcript_20916:242-1366(+)